MAEIEKKKDSEVPEPAPTKPDSHELPDESLDKVAGGMGAAIPHVGHASLLKGSTDPCCLG
jgi:hypothetical protein